LASARIAPKASKAASGRNVPDMNRSLIRWWAPRGEGVMKVLCGGGGAAGKGSARADFRIDRS
jgi:hypothetical protein